MPTLLDAYSHWGLSKIIERVDTLKRCKASCEAELLGILYSKVDTKSTLENRRWRAAFAEWEQEHRQRFRRLYRNGCDRVVFQTAISNADVIRKSEAEHCPLAAYNPKDSNLRRSRDRYQEEWVRFVGEILDRIEALKS